MSCCGYTDCESIEDYEEQEDFSSADAREAPPHQSPPPTHCDASVLSSAHTVSDAAPLPPLTSRVLFHPTFEAYYAVIAVQRNLETPEMQLRMEEGFPANREEYFYSDPLLAPGRRVYNCLSAASHSVFDWFRLQTPPPIMSSCIFPSTYQDNPMSDEDVSGDPLDDRPPVAMAAPCCSPSPALYTPSELDAACGLLHLSSAVSR